MEHCQQEGREIVQMNWTLAHFVHELRSNAELLHIHTTLFIHYQTLSDFFEEAGA